MINKLINFISLRRCGTHAVGIWLLHQDKTLSEYKHPPKIEQTKFPREGNLFVNSIHMPGRQVDIQKSYNNVILSIEEGEVTKFRNKNIESHKEFTVINLRDFRNFAASYCKHQNKLPRWIVDQWIERAEIILELKDFPYDLFINYNEWVLSKNYRRSIVDNLGLDFTDFGVDNVPNFGEGSSFDKRNLDGRAKKMKVLDRFGQIDKNYENIILSHSKAIELSDKIFSL